MSSIGNVSSYGSSMVSGMGGRHHRPDPAKMAEDLFAKIDSKNQGYIEKSDLASAMAQLSGNASGSSATASVDDVFGQLDSNGDGKVTKDEMSSSLKKLSQELDSQFDQMRMAGGGMGGMSSMPLPPQNDAGFTKDELQKQLDEIGSSDSKRSELISRVVSNFDKADTDGDGKVSFKEAMAFDRQGSTSTSTSDSSSSSASSTSNSSTGSTTSANSTSSDLAVMRRIMDLMHAYSGNDSQQSSLLSALRLSA